jgi:hypothetical protein
LPEPLQIAACFLVTKEEQDMTFYSRPPGFSEPRDPREIHEQVAEAGDFLSLIALAVIVAIAFGLFFLYAGESTQPTIAAPPAAQTDGPAQKSAAQPPTQNSTP